MLCFSNRGKVYWLKVYELPQAGRGSRGKPMVNLLPLEEGEKHQRRAADQAVRREPFRVHGHEPGHGQEDAADGVLAAARQRHHRASSCETDDRLVGVGTHRRPRARSSCARAAARRSASTKKKCGRWAARPPACAASSSATGQELIALIVVGDGHRAHGLGRTATASSRRSRISRCTAAAARASSRCRPPSATAQMVGALQVNAGHELMLISSTGTLVRTPVGEISIVGRNTQGVRLIRLGRRRAPDRHRAHRQPGRGRGTRRCANRPESALPSVEPDIRDGAAARRHAAVLIYSDASVAMTSW